MFSCRYCEIFKNTYFEEHLRTAASRMWEENPHSPCFVLPMFFRFLRRKKSIWVNPVCLSFHKTYIKLQFYFPLWLMFKYFAIHVFFTPAWDFTSVFLTGVKSDRREVLLCRERVNNTRSLCWDRGEFASLHYGLPKWNHTCNHPLTMPG